MPSTGATDGSDRSIEASDHRLADYVRLRETSLRRHLEAERGLFIAEGEKVIRRAVEAGYRPRSFLLAERWLAGLADVLDRWPDVPVYVVGEALAEQVTGFHVHRGALASLHRELRPQSSDLLGRAPAGDWRTSSTTPTSERSCAVPQDSAGTAPCCSPRCADPLYRRSIKITWARCSRCPGPG